MKVRELHNATFEAFMELIDIEDAESFSWPVVVDHTDFVHGVGHIERCTVKEIEVDKINKRVIIHTECA